MIAFEWSALVLGFATGAVMSTLFFAGLALGTRYALRNPSARPVLALSALVRIALFLGIGWVVVTQAGPWAFAGYGIAFLLTRRIATRMARVPETAGDAQ